MQVCSSRVQAEGDGPQEVGGCLLGRGGCARGSWLTIAAYPPGVSEACYGTCGGIPTAASPSPAGDAAPRCRGIHVCRGMRVARGPGDVERLKTPHFPCRSRATHPRGNPELCRRKPTTFWGRGIQLLWGTACAAKRTPRGGCRARRCALLGRRFALWIPPARPSRAPPAASLGPPRLGPGPRPRVWAGARGAGGVLRRGGALFSRNGARGLWLHARGGPFWWLRGVRGIPRDGGGCGLASCPGCSVYAAGNSKTVPGVFCTRAGRRSGQRRTSAIHALSGGFRLGHQEMLCFIRFPFAVICLCSR
jgi:hypothetical protein